MVRFGFDVGTILGCFSGQILNEARLAEQPKFADSFAVLTFKIFVRPSGDKK